MRDSYYVYAYIHPNGIPYYIGKGKGKRAWGKHSVPIPPNNQIVFLETRLTEIGAWAIERRLIRWHGRKFEGGILDNKMPGGPIGRGCKEYYQKLREDWENSDEYKERMQHWEYMESIRAENKAAMEEFYNSEEGSTWYMKYCNGEINLDD